MEHPTAEKVLLVPTLAGLSGEFQAAERAQHLSARPFALLRECLEDAASSTIASLLEAYLRTEFAKRLDSDQFNWKLIHGTGIWLLDGLDKVLERGLTRLIARARDKDLPSDIPDQGIRDVLESCAVTDLLHGGVPVDEVREYAEVVIPGGIPDDELDRLATQMGQIAVFAQGADGRLRFAQEPLEHYLATNYLAQSLKTTPQMLGGIELAENVLRLMLSCIDPDALGSVWNLLVDEMSEKSVAGRNALRSAVGISAGTDRLADIQFAGLDLSRVRFDGHDLREVSFDGADLTNTDFRGADPTGESSDTNGQATSACAAARRLRQIFGKFVEETGQGRRKHLDKRAVLDETCLEPGCSHVQ